ncbi:hypothetical protein CLOSTASPAR_03089 [[Clostridium] asparagiforme DSM 15981]|uniref:Uncharacterized protein n=1 Tax=[Clostridium] asparagiforme DSM 15981 TaxID=518636 RepID=C0D1F0_9FIRM|nr:hypothetical protein CLOSTASPAR_03089 [[Clostridium] asparagiforme DSM 15981]
MVIADIFSGIKFARMIASPDMLPTAKWLGIRKKKTADAAITVPNVMINHSDNIFLGFMTDFLHRPVFGLM